MSRNVYIRNVYISVTLLCTVFYVYIYIYIYGLLSEINHSVIGCGYIANKTYLINQSVIGCGYIANKTDLINQ